MMPALQSALVRVLAAWLAGGALLAGAAGLDAVRADEGYFIGDSIAAATAQTIGMRGSAHHSVSLRRNAIAPQFLQVPKGAVALMTLGLNDAAIPVSAMHKDIETVIEGAQRTGERIVWIGPPCVLKSWDNRAREMDDYLRRRLATTNIQYVSLRDPQICRPGMRSGDGEHFTDAGYRYVWQKVQRDSSFAATVELSKSRPVIQASATPRRSKSAKRSGHGGHASYSAAGEDAQQGSHTRRRRAAQDDGS
jgi:hypothetical protein